MYSITFVFNKLCLSWCTLQRYLGFNLDKTSIDLIYHLYLYCISIKKTFRDQKGKRQMFIDQLDRSYAANQERLNRRQEEKDRGKQALSLPSTSAQTSEKSRVHF